MRSPFYRVKLHLSNKESYPYLKNETSYNNKIEKMLIIWKDSLTNE